MKVADLGVYEVGLTDLVIFSYKGPFETYSAGRIFFYPDLLSPWIFCKLHKNNKISLIISSCF